MLHYILKCNHFGMTIFRDFVKIISIPDEELFSKTAVGCTAPHLILIIWCSHWFCTPSSHLRQCIALYTVAEGWLLLDIGWFVLLFHPKCFYYKEWQLRLSCKVCVLRILRRFNNLSVISQLRRINPILVSEIKVAWPGFEPQNTCSESQEAQVNHSPAKTEHCHGWFNLHSSSRA